MPQKNTINVRYIRDHDNRCKIIFVILLEHNKSEVIYMTTSLNPVNWLDSDREVQIENSLRFFGTLIVDNPPLPSELLNGVLKQAQWFFGLDRQKKLSLGYEQDDLRGYREVCTEKEGSIGYEMFDFGEERQGPGEILGRPNRWPDENEEFKNISLNFLKASSSFIMQLLPMAARVARLELEEMTSYLQSPIMTGTLLHYLPGESSEEANREHSDFGTLTLLFSNGISGLEMELDGRWERITIAPGQCLVNAGDILNRWSGNRIPAVKHRVVTPSADRYSMVFFMNADRDAPVSKLPHEAANPVPTVTDYILQRIY